MLLVCFDFRDEPEPQDDVHTRVPFSRRNNWAASGAPWMRWFACPGAAALNASDTRELSVSVQDGEVNVSFLVDRLAEIAAILRLYRRPRLSGASNSGEPLRGFRNIAT